MEGILSDYYITIPMISDIWNNEGYTTIKGNKWTSDKLRDKFETIVSAIEKHNTKRVLLRSYFRSENGVEIDGHYIFFNSEEIMAYKAMLKEEDHIQKHVELQKKKPLYADEYDLKTSEALKRIFILYDKYGGIEYLNCHEIEDFIDYMEAVVPQHRKMDKYDKIIKEVSLRKQEEMEEKSRDYVKELEGEWREAQNEIREQVRGAYLSTRKELFFRKRIYVDKYYYKTGQKDYLIDWKRRWLYVIDGFIQAKNEDSKFLDSSLYDVEDIIQILLIWYQNERWRKNVLADKVRVAIEDGIKKIVREKAKRVRDEINKMVKRELDKFTIDNVAMIRSDRNGFIADTKQLVQDVFCYGKSNIADDRTYFIIMCFMLDDLENIRNVTNEEKERIDKKDAKEGKNTEYRGNYDFGLISNIEKSLEIVESI